MHITTRARIALTTLAATAILAACGGGGGGGDSATAAGSAAPVASAPATPVASAPGTPVASAITIYPAVSGVAIPALAADAATNAFTWTNFQRARLGLAPLARSPALDRAAAAHVAYIVANNSYASEGHIETAGRPGFTGITVADRVLAAGFTGGSASENLAVATTTQGRDATDSLIEAPYHRQTQFFPFASAGAAAAAGANGVYAIDFGGSAGSGYGPGPSQVVVYPVDGDTAAPIDWFALEAPNPLPDLAGRRVGFPISLASTGALAVSSFGLKDDRGVAVTTRLVTTRTDSGQALANYAFVVPLAPLASGSAYIATAAGTVGTTPFSVSWRFTTAAAGPLTVTASAGVLAATAGATVDVTIAGGNGRYLTAGTGIGYTASAPVGGQVDLLTIETVSTGRLRLVRNPMPCSGVISSCFVRIVGSDSAGTQTTLDLPIR